MTNYSDESVSKTYFNLGTIPFWAIHVAAIIGVIVLGFSWSGLIWAFSAYAIRMFFVTAGYHRYFSHRTFKTSRWFQFILAFVSQSSAQRGVMWWASRHRQHHRESDGENDLHSPGRRGFWWSHVGWMLSNRYNDTEVSDVRDLARYPELRLLNRLPHLPVVVLAVALFLVGGAHALVWGFFVSTVFVWHGTFTINSLSHILGRRRYRTDDDSRNNWALAMLTLGEGWHNNHHYYQSSASQGFFWWELDITMLILRGLQRVRLISDLRSPPQHVLEGRKRRDLPVTELIATGGYDLGQPLPAAAMRDTLPSTEPSI